MARNDYGRHPQDTRHPEHPKGTDPRYLDELAARCSEPYTPEQERGRRATLEWLNKRRELLAQQGNSTSQEAAHLL